MSPRRPTDPADAGLIARAIAGDQAAFGDLYEHYLPAVYRYVFYRVADEHEAEDLTETVFVKAWEALGRYRPTEAPFAAWLYRIAHNLLIDRRRAQKAVDPLAERMPDLTPGADPASHMDRREQAAALARALAQLDAAQQEVLTLRFVSNLSHAETAQVMGRSEGAVRVLQHRALAALRRLLIEKVEP